MAMMGARLFLGRKTIEVEVIASVSQSGALCVSGRKLLGAWNSTSKWRELGVGDERGTS
jgi:hypothetical protein